MSPWVALTPSCHSEPDGFICVKLSHNPVSPSVWLLSLCSHSPASVLLSVATSSTTTSLCSFFTFISTVSSPQIPLAHYLRFFLSLLYHSSCEHLIIPYLLFLFSLPSLIAFLPPNLPLFTASLHLLMPFANLHFFYLFFLLTSIKPRIVFLSGVLIPKCREDVVQEMNWLTAECICSSGPLF